MKMNKKTGKPLVASEKEIRSNILTRAKYMFVEEDVKRILDRYDRLIKECKNEQESYQIRVLGAIEIHKALKYRGELVLDGKLILPAADDYDPNWDDKN
jgi:hypothetical protein